MQHPLVSYLRFLPYQLLWATNSCLEDPIHTYPDFFNPRLFLSGYGFRPHVFGEYSIQLFRERLSEKMCTRQSRKVISDMINTLFLTTVAVEPTFVAFL